MQRAPEHAARGRGFVEPNPMVGAVIVKEGRVIGEGFHARFGGPHAEVVALGDARSRGRDAKGATLYVTLEPCVHHGKTPPCAPAIIEAGLERVVIATLDPTWAKHVAASRAPSPDSRSGQLVQSKSPVEDLKSKNSVRCPEILPEAGIKAEVGLCREEAVVLNAAFFKRSRTGLPLVIAKWAMSVDGKIATRTGASRWISCPDSRKLVHELRGRVDAIVVGSGTVARDDPLLTCREAELCRSAARVVLCGRSAPSVECNLARTAHETPVLLAHVQGAAPEGLDSLKKHGCELLALPSAKDNPEAVDIRSLLSALGKRGASNVLVEGGRQVLGGFFDERLVDKVMVFLAPFIIGGAEAVTAVGGRGVDSLKAAIPAVGARHSAFAAEVASAKQAASSLRQTPQAARETTVRPVGRDLLLEFWTVDPLQWAS